VTSGRGFSTCDKVTGTLSATSSFLRVQSYLRVKMALMFYQGLENSSCMRKVAHIMTRCMSQDIPESNLTLSSGTKCLDAVTASILGSAAFVFCAFTNALCRVAILLVVYSEIFLDSKQRRHCANSEDPASTTQCWRCWE
jgi:hypothetical protein